jgi:hypothetical protein
MIAIPRMNSKLTKIDPWIHHISYLRGWLVLVMNYLGEKQVRCEGGPLEA